MVNETKKLRILIIALSVMLATAAFPVVAYGATVNVASQTDITNAIAGAGVAPTTLAMTTNINVNATITIPATADITLSGPYTLTMTTSNNIFAVNGKFTLDGPTLTHGSGLTGRAVTVASTGTFIMESGTITENHTPNFGGAVLNNGTFVMNGGTLYRNTAAWDGGAVFNNHSGLCDLDGGTISNNAADWGGGVGNADGAIMGLAGVLITENEANRGGGVHNAGNLHFENGTISWNYATDHGGGIYNNGGELSVYDGMITDNTASHYGGGIYSTAGILSFTDAVIANNEAEHGGGAYIDEPTYDFVFGGYSVIGNVASAQGGGLFLNVKSALIESCIIGENSAEHGGGIYMTTQGATLTLASDCTLENNVAAGVNPTSGRGGGVFSAGSVVVTGATLRGNSATNGGGIFITDGVGASCTITSGEISNNTATSNGGGVWIARTELANLTTAAGVVFSGNKALGPYDRDPADDALYASHILSTVWSTPLKQGYNNWDIAYVGLNAVPRFSVTFAPGAHGAFTGVIYIDVLRDSATPTPPTPTPAAGWKFAGWSPALAATVTGNVTYTALWEAIIPPTGDGLTLWIPLALTLLGFVCIGDAVRRKR